MTARGAGHATADVVVVGGGIVGASCAWRLALAGACVTLVDPEPGGGASHAAAGMLGAGSEAWFGHERLLAWCRASMQRWPHFRAELEVRSGVRVPSGEAGTLLVAAEPGDAADLRRLLRLLHAEGVAARPVTAEEAAAREPALTPRVAGAVHVDEPALDPRAVVAALLADLEALGVPVVRDRVAEVLGGGLGVRLSCGDVLAADRVVVAAGYATAGLAGVPRQALGGLHPVKGQILRLAPGGAPESAPPLRHVVRGWVAGRAVYAVPYGDGRVAVGATSEDRDDLDVTAGAVHRLLDDALRLVPGLGELVLAETTARLRPATDAGVPVVAEVAPGVVVATGHGRHGVLLAPATAEAVTSLVSGGGLPSWVPSGDDARPVLGVPPAVPPAGSLAVPDGVRDGARPTGQVPGAPGTPAVVVNGEPRPLPPGLTVAALLAQVAPAFTGGRGLAVAVDAEVVPRDRWDAVVLRGGEHVEVLTAIQGG